MRQKILCVGVCVGVFEGGNALLPWKKSCIPAPLCVCMWASVRVLQKNQIINHYYDYYLLPVHCVCVSLDVYELCVLQKCTKLHNRLINKTIQG